jgi:hypothetical protein
MTAPTLDNIADWLDTDDHRDEAFRLHQFVATQAGPYVAAAWLIGQNPHLGNDSPHHAIRDGHGADARNAARAYLNDKEQQ